MGVGFPPHRECFEAFRLPVPWDQEDEACQKLLEDLLSYAVYAVAKNEADIRDTLRNRVKALQLSRDPLNQVLDWLVEDGGSVALKLSGTFDKTLVLYSDVQ